ncbi:vitamin K epoxide reductase family protein [Tsukamurella paurometabola]|uniref:vitamin K epoxide reductase family protein n=1 Tax=Tsukamurella paurometabola TaxID=2061 RepID=UPI0011C0826A|nr:vitamin K epoxide reductase family protein [Tsukamurella paurometabola]
MATVENRRPSGAVLIVTGALGLLASAMLTIDRIKLLQDPSFRPGCSIDGVLSCGSIMESAQGAVFGFPNPLLGLVAFTVVIVTGVLTAGGVPLPRWYWTGLAVGSAAGLVLLMYLIHASLYDIRALCLWCMLVWTVQPVVTAVATAGALGERATLQVKQGLAALVLVWYIVVITLIATAFWDYWSSKF